MKSALQCFICVVIVSLITNTSTAEKPPTTPKSQIIANCVDATAGLNIKGTIIINKTSRNPSYLPLVKFAYTSVTAEHTGHGFAYTRFTNQVRENLISDFLDQIPNLTPIRNRLLAEKTLDDSPPIANFTLHIVRKSDGYLSAYLNQTPERLVFHEQKLRTSGHATVVFSPEYNISNIEHFELMLSTLKQFSKLTSDLDCQNIWVTIKSGNRTKFGVCWKDGYELVIQGPPS